MKCDTVKVRLLLSEEGCRAVELKLGNYFRRTGLFDEVAWIELSPGMAREIADQLQEAAYEVKRANDKEKTP
jgi:hypothetical protein